MGDQEDDPRRPTEDTHGDAQERESHERPEMYGVESTDVVPSTDDDPVPRGEIVVILSAHEFGLPHVLRHLEAGRIVVVIPPAP